MVDPPDVPVPAQRERAPLAPIDLGDLTVADLEGRPDSVLTRALHRRLAEADEPGPAGVHYQRALG